MKPLKKQSRGIPVPADPRAARSQQEDLARMRSLKRISTLFLAAFCGLYILATVSTGFNPFAVFTEGRNFADFVTKDLFPPRFEDAVNLLEVMGQTIGLALISVLISAVLAFPLCFLASRRFAPPVLVRAVRGTASLARNIPDVIWVFVLVMVFGIGTGVGLIALVLHTLGFLMRAFADVVDEAGRESMEALESVGANLPAKLAQCVVPESLPGLVSWLLYALELNIRAAAVVGALGGGGIGLVMMGYLKSFRYHSGFGIILTIASAVIVVDLVTNALRKRVLL